MKRNSPLIPRKSINYFFLKSKDVHIENGMTFITLYGRLTREISSFIEGKRQTHVDTVWVEIEEIQTKHASQKVRDLPNCLQRYAISENVFYNLYHLSKKHPENLFLVIPYHYEVSRKDFIPYQQLNSASPL